MTKRTGGTRNAGSNTTSATRTTNASNGGFSSQAKLSSFDGDSTMSGGYYTKETKDGKYSMVIETENGYNEAYGGDGTLISVGIRKGTGPVERLTNSFVEAGTPYRESMGYTSYNNNTQVTEHINKSMPYYADLANKWIKKNG